MSSTTDAVSAVSSLAEPNRRRIYELVASTRAGMTRDDVALEADMPRTTAAFHLDRLVADGLLRASFVRRSGRSGPGAGRPAKVYLRVEDAVTVSLPPRHYDLAGDLLAAAVEEAQNSGESVSDCLARRALDAGRDHGRPDLTDALVDCGYEPYRDGDSIALANCPFHSLAARHPDLVCGMNLSLVTGLVEAAENCPLVPRLAPSEQDCCVRLEPPR